MLSQWFASFQRPGFVGSTLQKVAMDLRLAQFNWHWWTNHTTAQWLHPSTIVCHWLPVTSVTCNDSESFSKTHMRCYTRHCVWSRKHLKETTPRTDKRITHSFIPATKSGRALALGAFRRPRPIQVRWHAQVTCTRSVETNRLW